MTEPTDQLLSLYKLQERIEKIFESPNHRRSTSDPDQHWDLLELHSSINECINALVKVNWSAYEDIDDQGKLIVE